ncbi:3718_t:CDS:2 [Entrophospora sp. SA101]|nr:3718_t:CDS:2 [Entrophospora sp. SA101]
MSSKDTIFGLMHVMEYVYLESVNNIARNISYYPDQEDTMGPEIRNAIAQRENHTWCNKDEPPAFIPLKSLRLTTMSLTLRNIEPVWFTGKSEN